MEQRSKNLAWWIPLIFALSACSGALDGPAGGGPLGAPNGNFAQGTLGSQPEIQQMSNECLSLYTMRFSGEAAGETKSWFQIQEDQKYFPTPGLILKSSKEGLPNEEICPNCEGRIVRVIDFGDPGFNPLRFSMDYGMFMASLRNHSVRPEILAQARYQDFPVSAVSDVSFKALPVVSGNLYVLLLSNKELEPMTEPTAFNSAEELYAMMECSKHPEAHPFMSLRTFVASYNDPAITLHMPPSVPVTIDDPQGSSKGTIKKSGMDDDNGVAPAGQRIQQEKLKLKDEDD